MIAQVYVDVQVPHLDHVFDYAIPDGLANKVHVGIRVKVPFNGRSLAGFVVGIAETSAQEKLQTLSTIVSEVPVMPEATIALIRAVADHCAGTFMDVARLAIPPRHARAEKNRLTVEPEISVENKPSCLDRYPEGTSLRQAIRAGKSPRAAWTLVPARAVGDWVEGITSLVSDTLASGRSVLVLAPEVRDCAALQAAITMIIDRRLVVSLAANRGPHGRYSAFLAGLSGQARVIVGSRGAAYAPMKNLGLIVVWEEADPIFEEQHCPYPSLRDIVAIRAAQEKAGVVFVSYSRSVEIQNWVDKKWLHEVVMGSQQVSFHTASIRVASHGDHSLAHDRAARSARLPHDGFSVIQAGLGLGPVLVSVPWVGQRRNFICQSCGEPMKCSCGSGFEESESMSCVICGKSAQGWRCVCGSHRFKAIIIGSQRTAHELAQSFKNALVLRSDSTSRIDWLSPSESTSVIVVATPGCEPVIDKGYSAAVILDAAGVLARPDIRVGEEALRRWLRIISLVRSGEDLGTVLIVGPGQDRTIQAALRCDPLTYARRELRDRQEAGFPPATRMAVFSGDESAVAHAAQEWSKTGIGEMIGPIQEVDSDQYRLIIRVGSAQGTQLAAWLAETARTRSSRKRNDKLNIRLDPVWLGG
ncbi:MAG: hypothetical protein FWD55_03790 [Propionibacteriaceae bacterium]|nr:hypothetical protein [Propionibacteriaceae bacterium]